MCATIASPFQERLCKEGIQALSEKENQLITLSKQRTDALMVGDMNVRRILFNFNLLLNFQSIFLLFFFENSRSGSLDFHKKCETYVFSQYD